MMTSRVVIAAFVLTLTNVFVNSSAWAGTITYAWESRHRPTSLFARTGYSRKRAWCSWLLDRPNANPSESIRLLFAGEKVRAEHPLPSPEMIDSLTGWVTV
jgi:hypothetical protein